MKNIFRKRLSRAQLLENKLNKENYLKNMHRGNTDMHKVAYEIDEPRANKYAESKEYRDALNMYFRTGAYKHKNYKDFVGDLTGQRLVESGEGYSNYFGRKRRRHKSRRATKTRSIKQRTAKPRRSRRTRRTRRTRRSHN